MDYLIIGFIITITFFLFTCILSESMRKRKTYIKPIKQEHRINRPKPTKIPLKRI